MKPELWQTLLMLLTGLSYALAFFLGFRRLNTATTAETATPSDPTPARLGPAVRLIFGFGFLLLILLSLARWSVFTQQITAPAPATGPALVFFYFDVFLLFGLLLSLLVAYFRFTTHLRWLGFFLLPVSSLSLIVGWLLSLLNEQTFDGASWLNRLHLCSVLAGSMSFAAACTGGVVFLLADWQLRHRALSGTRNRWRLPALSLIEKFLQHAIFLGFPLLTVAMISGTLWAFRTGTLKAHWYTSPKILLALAAWIVYAFLLHVPLAPAFRGRRAAWLSITGFALLLAVFWAVRLQGGM